MSSVQLQAEKREKLGSLSAKRIKKAGRIPAVIHSKNGNVNVSFDKREFEIEFHKGDLQTKVAEITVDGKKIKAITHRVELDPVSDAPIHADLFNCADTKEIKAQPKVVFNNKDKSPGLKRGGFLHVNLRKIEVVCDNESVIPATIEIDISKLQVSQKIRSENVTLEKGVRFAKKGSFLIASIIGRGKAEEEDKAADAAAAAAATAAPAGEKKAEEKKEEKK